ncbi:MAG TPA: hypothetical protein PKJ44_03035, partial [Thauera aminoaromatica]|nr:hypothetical protein [Thauera aminoaromatica]
NGQPRDDIALGRRMNTLALTELKRRLEANDWTGPGFGRMNEFTLPPWAYSDDPLDVAPRERAFDYISETEAA